ncbi:MAG: hypothetical protein MHM6MM_005356 [Cercozoa sp. M6MM]
MIKSCSDSSTVHTRESSSAPIRRFCFDGVFGPEAHQEEVFQQAARNSIDDVLCGYNGTIFVYGQTGSGKTHSVFGDEQTFVDLSLGTLSQDVMPDGAGFVPRGAFDLFDRIQSLLEEGETEHVSVSVSFAEIYNEQLRDLLAPPASDVSLKCREEPDGKVRVIGLTEVVVHSAPQLLRVVSIGASTRTTKKTTYNTRSSRSHAVLTLKVLQKRRRIRGQIVDLEGELNFVDLAGSERLHEKSEKSETVNINGSLTVLGRCVRALSRQQEDTICHVPYRESTLTFLLRNSLRGLARTVFVATMAQQDPSQSDAASIRQFRESFSTLRFASAAKKVKVNTKRNMRQNGIVVQLQNEVAALQHTLCLVNDEHMQQHARVSHSVNMLTERLRELFAFADTIRNVMKVHRRHTMQLERSSERRKKVIASLQEDVACKKRMIQKLHNQTEALSKQHEQEKEQWQTERARLLQKISLAQQHTQQEQSTFRSNMRQQSTQHKEEVSDLLNQLSAYKARYSKLKERASIELGNSLLRQCELEQQVTRLSVGWANNLNSTQSENTPNVDELENCDEKWVSHDATSPTAAASNVYIQVDTDRDVEEILSQLRHPRCDDKAQSEVSQRALSMLQTP